MADTESQETLVALGEMLVAAEARRREIRGGLVIECERLMAAMDRVAKWCRTDGYVMHIPYPALVKEVLDAVEEQAGARGD